MPNNGLLAMNNAGPWTARNFRATMHLASARQRWVGRARQTDTDLHQKLAHSHTLWPLLSSAWTWRRASLNYQRLTAMRARPRSPRWLRHDHDETLPSAMGFNKAVMNANSVLITEQ